MKHRIVEANILQGNVILTFDSGETAVYPADLLHALLRGVEKIFATDEPDLPKDVITSMPD